MDLFGGVIHLTSLLVDNTIAMMVSVVIVHQYYRRIIR